VTTRLLWTRSGANRPLFLLRNAIQDGGKVRIIPATGAWQLKFLDA